MLKGEVFLADLGSSSGHEQEGKRPVIICQNDLLNKVSQTVIVIPLTTNLKREEIPGVVLIKKGEGGLDSDSVALCYQLRVLDKKRLKRQLGKLSEIVLEKVYNGIKFTLGIS
jgi:mRNA interferase MazF